MLRLRLAFPALMFAALIAAGCGGGGSGGSVIGQTPTPTATPSPVTPSSPAPAYCSSYQSNTSTGAVPLNITDDSGLGAALMVYVQSGKYMDNTGQFNSTLPYPLPAACFSTTLGSGVQSKPLNIPNGANGRIYFAYTAATPNPSPSATPPNPFGAGGTTFNPSYADSPFPWDKIEYDIAPGSGIIDTTQVDFAGLPIEMSLTGALPHQAAGSCPAAASSVVGVTSCGYANVFTQMLAASEYSNLVITQNFNGKLIDLRVVAPKESRTFTPFQWNLFDLPSYAPMISPCNAGNTGANGYLQCVLASYQTTQRIFTSNVPGANGSGDWYCATSDGSANFIFTDVGTSAPATCPAAANPRPQLAANPFKLPIATLAYGVPPAQDQGGSTACQYNNLFGQPYGLFYVDNQTGQGPTYRTPGNLFSNTDAFALWKALSADLNYGQALQPGQHPVGEFVTLQTSSFWLDHAFNVYSKILHANFDSNLAYSIAYDDLFRWSTSQTLQAGNAINIRINAVPAASSVNASSSTVPDPSSCPVIAPEIGTY
ncbi:MAG TPA: beta-1,3-glucanase family protein [Candidatus Baltobacteraceae bacterium]|nr:beta-1,3-glucanase family protein [Candidatus Baltobacteraceae bacterium]